jgi:general secretion pathway protein C
MSLGGERRAGPFLPDALRLVIEVTMTLDALLRRFFPVVVGGLLAPAAYLQASGLNALLEVTLLEGGSRGGLRASAVEPGPTHERREHVTSAAAILARNPFDSITGPLDGTEKPLALPPPGLAGPREDVPCDAGQVVLIMSSEDPEWSFAAIAIGSERSLRRRGDDVDGKVVERIGWDRVWLVHEGTRCELVLGARDPSAKPTGRPSPSVPMAKKASRSKVPADIASKIQKVSDREFIVERSALDRILENQAALMKSVRLVPEKKDGAVVALRMSRVAPDSLLGMLGLKKGDRIRSINGFSLTDPQKALEAYARLRTADRLTLSIQRGGKDANIDFRIQ